MRAIFITGTDTGVGKTTVADLLGRLFLDKGYRVIVQKWIRTGGADFFNTYLPHIFVYTFKFASSPHLAAALEKRKISANKIKNSFKSLQKRYDFVIVEGIGGALVPYNRKNLVIDIAKELKLPVLIVAANKLGAINHTLLTIEAVKRRGMKIIGVVFNNIYKHTNEIILKDNVDIVRKLTKENILGTLPHEKDKSKLYNKAFLYKCRGLIYQAQNVGATFMAP